MHPGTYRLTTEQEAAQEPNYTRVPNDLMDYWLLRLSGSELKVLLYLMRRTFGFHRRGYEVGLRRISAAVGLHSETTELAIKRLQTLGLLSCENRPGRRTTYILEFTREVYGKSEHQRTENPNTRVYGKSAHVERKSSSLKKRAKKEILSAVSARRVSSVSAETQQSPFQSKIDDDGKRTTVDFVTYASPEDELCTIYRNKTGTEITRDILNRISELCELRNVSLAVFVAAIRPHVPNHWKNPAGFLTDFAKRFRSKTHSARIAEFKGSSGAEDKQWRRCVKCRGIGKHADGYCECPMGQDLKRVEQRV